MSILIFILFCALWIFLLWAISVIVANKFKALAIWPEYWLAVLTACLVPPIGAVLIIGFGIHVPNTFIALGGLENLPIVETVIKGNDRFGFFKYVAVGGLVVYLIGVGTALYRLIGGWRRLANAKASGHFRVIKGHNTIITDADIPPCTFGFWRPDILMPKALFEDLGEKMLSCVLDHEAAHIRHRDPAILLCLHMAEILFWPHSAIHDLVKRWTFAIELRADNYALAGVNKNTRKEYGQILVNVLRDLGAKENRGTWPPTSGPCPSATLNLSNYRSAKMRVKNILNENPKLNKSRHQKMKLALFAFGMSVLGAGGLAASAGPSVSSDRDAQPSVRFPPIFPAKCMAKDGKFAASVNVKFDVTKNGVVENIQVTKSDNPCFNQATINSVAKWKYEPVLQNGKPRKRNGVQAMIKYMSSRDEQ